MRDILSDIDRWLHDGRTVALATVIKAWGSSPRPAGSVMAITGDGRIAGSVSGGCIEAEVIASALDSLIDGEMRFESFHATTKKAHEVGLSCGGDVDICIRPLDREAYALLRQAILDDRPYFYATGIDGNCRGVEACILEDETAAGSMDESLLAQMLPVIQQWKPGNSTLQSDVAAGTVFVEYNQPKPQIISIGATHVAISLMKMAKVLGYRTVVIDPRAVFATEERFSFVDELIHGWPQKVLTQDLITSSTAICALTHDPKIDEPALEIATDSEAFYIGSLGRSTTQVKRYKALKSRGIPDEKIARIYGPIGLDIGGKNPSEIALSILSEINAAKHGKQLETRTMLDTALGELAASAERKRSFPSDRNPWFAGAVPNSVTLAIKPVV